MVMKEKLENFKANESKDLLSQFYDLASLEESKRIQAVVNIINLLKTSKKADVEYTVERLVKGLSSSRKAARQGYATALTHLIGEFKEVTYNEISDLMTKHLNVTGSMKGQEEREHYFGLVFGYIAICKGKLNENTEPDFLQSVIENLLKLSKKKSYLQEMCAKAVSDILNMIDDTVFEKHVHEVLKPVLMSGWAKCSPEDLLITLTVQKQFRETIKDFYFAEHWDNADILDASNFHVLSKVLMNTTDTTHPRMHILWDTVIERILKRDVEYLTKFWKVVVEDHHLQSTHERKFLAMHILLHMSSLVSEKQVDVIYSKRILRCIINSSQSKENYLYNAVKDMLKRLPDKVASNQHESVAFSVIKCLVGSNGHILFDATTHTKTVDEILGKSKIDVNKYFGWLQDIFIHATNFHGESSSNDELVEKDVMNTRGWVASQMVVLFRCCKAQNKEDVLVDILNFLFLHGHFEILKKYSKIRQLNVIPIEANIIPHALIQQRFGTVLNEITHFYPLSHNEGSKLQPFGGLSSEGNFYALKVLKFSQVLLKSPKYVCLKGTWTPEFYDVFENTMTLIDGMEHDESGSLAKMKGTQLLFIHTVLQLFINNSDAVDVLQELQTCYKKAEEKKKRKKTEPHWADVLTEILLGFLLQSSHLLRQVVDMVFPSITPHLTEEAFQSLLNAIKPKANNATGSIDIEKDSEDEGEQLSIGNEEDNENLEDDARENDKERIDGEDDDEDESEDEDIDDDDSDMEIDEEFKTKLKDALGDSAININDEQSDDTESDLDMDALDDETLAKMDEALAAVFKARQEKEQAKKDNKTMKLSILHFKLRVLDLIEIFIKKQPKDKKILLLIVPLLEILKSSDGRADDLPFFERTLGIFKNKLCQLHEYPSGADLNVEEAHQQIESLFNIAKTASSALFVSYVTLGIVYLIRVLRGNPEMKGPSPLKTRGQRKKREIKTAVVVKINDHVGCLNEERIVLCFTEALAEFMTKRHSHLQPTLFTEVFQRFPELGWRLSTCLPQYINTACNNFRKVKACEMLRLLFSKKTKCFSNDLVELSPCLLENLCKALESTKDDGFSLKARQFQCVLHLTDIYVKEIMKNEKLKVDFGKEQLHAAFKTALDSQVVTRSSAVQAHCHKICVQLESTVSDSASDKQSKKRKKKT